MRVLVACEFSGRVREAFKLHGHDAWSCDLLPSEIIGQHYQCDVRQILDKGWDLLIAHPPCTYLAVSGARWFKERIEEQKQALDFVKTIMDAPVLRIAIENPVSVISSKIRKPDQIIQPWMFGEPEAKATCLWLKNLPKLEATSICVEKQHSVHYEPPSKYRWKNRSRTFWGIAFAMAHQWGKERVS